MRTWLRRQFHAAYERLLRREIDGAPAHVAVIQDGNRRYARQQGDDARDGYDAGARTTEDVLRWCAELGVEELTLYTFSTENEKRPADQREHLFDLLSDKLREFADAERVHEDGVRIRAIGDVDRLPDRVQEAVAYAERRTRDHDQFDLNVAVGYGGRTELLGAVRDVARDVAAGDLDPADVSADTVEARLHGDSVRDVDLILRTGGDERTSNFLPWHANGNEAAAVFCTPYWPDFSKVDLLRAIRTYQRREESWRRARALRALSLLRAVGGTELAEARRVLRRFRDHLPRSEATDAVEEAESDPTPAD